MPEGAAVLDRGLGHGTAPKQPMALLMPDGLLNAQAPSGAHGVWGTEGINDVDEVQEALRATSDVQRLQKPSKASFCTSGD